MNKKETRIEKDSMGEFEVPIDAMYGASTARAIENFPISELKVHPLKPPSLLSAGRRSPLLDFFVNFCILKDFNVTFRHACSI